jgi:hypothetical protein
MAKDIVTFDPTSGVAYGINLVINTGASFVNNFSVLDVSGKRFQFYKLDYDLVKWQKASNRFYILPYCDF